MKRRLSDEHSGDDESLKKARLDDAGDNKYMIELEDFEFEELVKMEIREETDSENAIDFKADYYIKADEQFIFPQEDLIEENEWFPEEGICQGLSIDYIVHNIKSDIDSPSYLSLLSSGGKKLSYAYAQKIMEYQNIL